MTDLEHKDHENQTEHPNSSELLQPVEPTVEETAGSLDVESDGSKEEVNIHKLTNQIVPGIEFSKFDELTRKNQQFIMTVWRQVKNHQVDKEVVAPAFKEIYETLLAGQATSETAQHIYGTPTEVVDSMLGLNKKETNEAVDHRLEAKGWMIGVDGALLMGSIYTLLTGVAYLRGNQGTPMGVITLIINYLLAGFATTIMAKYLPNMDAPKKERGYLKYTLASVSAMLVWIMIVSASILFLPPVINPIFPPIVYIIIGLGGLLGRYLLRQRYRIEGGLF